MLLPWGAASASWWRDADMYRIVVPSFKDSDGDGIGDLVGVREQLRYVAEELDMDAVILSPIFEAAGMSDGWRDITNFTNVDPKFGSMTDFETLLSLASSLPLRVILEWVPNHSSNLHPWWIAATSTGASQADKDKYVWLPEEAATPNWVSFYGQDKSSAISTASTGRYYHAFLDTEPDLNYRSPAVVLEMNKILDFWLEKGVDGFLVQNAEYLMEDSQWRNDILPQCAADDSCQNFDAFEQAEHIRTQHQSEIHSVFQGWRQTVDHYGDRLLMVELERQVEEGTWRSYLGSEEAPEFHVVLTNHLNRAWSNVTDLVDLVQNSTRQGVNETQWVWNIGGPSFPRLASRVANTNDTIASLSLLRLLPGMTITSYGSEILLEDVPVSPELCRDPRCWANKRGNASETGRDRHWTPMQWDESANGGFSSIANGSLYLPIGNYSMIRADAPPSTDSGRARGVATSVGLFERTAEGVVSPDSNISFVHVSGVPALVATFDPGHTGHNTTTVVVNSAAYRTQLKWSDVTRQLGLVDKGELRWEVRYSTWGGSAPGTLIKPSHPVRLEPLEVISISWWIYGTTGIMDTAHWIYFGLLVGTNLMQVLTVFGVIFYTLRGCWNKRKARLMGEGSQMPGMSIIIPCYMPNEEPIIEETLEHALNNILYELAEEPLEPLPADFQSMVTVYVVYNAPPEWSHPIEAALAELDGCRRGRFNRLVRVIRVPASRSKAQNLNHVISEIADPYSVIYDADHHPDAMSLRTSLNMLVGRNLDCVQGSTYIRKGGCFMSFLIDAEFFVTYFVAFPAMQVIGQSGFFGGSNAVWRTDFLKAQQFDHSAQTEDIEFSIRAMLKRARIEFCPESRSGELAPPSCTALFKQRLRWAMGWDQVTFMHMKAVSRSKDLNCCRKFGMFYMLPARWALLFFSLVGVVSGTVVSGWWFIYSHYIEKGRYTSLGDPINVSNTISIIFVIFSITWAVLLALALQPTLASKLRLAVGVVAFTLGAPVYILFQLVLVVRSLFRLATGRVGGWVVTARQAPTALQTDTSAIGNFRFVVEEEIHDSSAMEDIPLRDSEIPLRSV